MTSLKPLFRNRGRLFALVLMAAAGVYTLVGDQPSDVLREASALEEAGKKPDLRHDIATGLWFAAAINFVVALVLFCTAPWWNRPLPPRTMPRPASAGRVFWIAVGLAVVVGGAWRSKLAARSLWWDELWNIKHTTVGYFRPDAKKDGELTFRENDWSKTLWNYRKPTNHPPLSAASRLCLDTWRAVTGGEPGSFHPFVARLPSLLAGLASIVCIALLLRRWGFVHAGVMAAFLLAVHPWHIRYGVDARAYSFVVLFSILACLWLSRALESGTWRDWGLFGLAQLLLTWSLPNAVWYAAAFFLCAVALVWMTRKDRAERKAAMGRLVVANVVAGMAFLQIFFPNLLQLLDWGKVNDHAFLSGPRLVEAFGQAAFGMAREWPESVEADGLAALANVPRPLLVAACILMALGFVRGIWRLVREHLPGAILFAGMFAAAGVYLLVTWKANHHFYPRYLIFLSVPLTACVAIGVGAFPRLRHVPAVLFFASFLAVTWPQIRVLNTRSYAPYAKVAEFLERWPEARVVGFGLGGRMLQVVHPPAGFADNIDQLRPFVDHASATGEPLLLVYGYREFNRAHPEVGSGFKLIDDPALFEQMAGFPGIEDLFYFRVLKFREGGIPSP